MTKFLSYISSFTSLLTFPKIYFFRVTNFFGICLFKKHFTTSCTLGILLLELLLSPLGFAEGKIKVGVPTALTGDAAAFGMDIKNALTLMNEKYGNGKYELIFEDERCESKSAVSVARKLIVIDKVRYALGFPCNSSMLATASIYDRAGVLVITSSATSGDQLDVGKNIFRLFPSDANAARLLYEYLQKQHKSIAILTEENEYPVMMERVLNTENRKRATPLEFTREGFVHGETDIRTILLKFISKGVEGIFVNANTDSSFVTVVKQIRNLNYQGSLYSAYLPGSSTIRKTLGNAVNGFIYPNIPMVDNLVTTKGKELMAEFRKRFGEPQSGFPTVPASFEAFRAFDLALQSGKNPREFLLSHKFTDGFIPDYYFDEHGAVQGIRFEMQKIQDGIVVVLKEK